MTLSHTSEVYRKGLKKKYRKYGWPLWQPVTSDRVSLGDIGYLRDGTFHRMFNIANNNEVPGYEPVTTENFTVNLGDPLSKMESGDHFSDSVRTTGESNGTRGYEFRKSRMKRRTGAVLYLPDHAYHEDWDGGDAEKAIKHLKGYVKDVLKFANEHFGDVKKIILVTGFSTESSWAAAAFLARDVNVELVSESQRLEWINENISAQDLDCHASPQSQGALSQCVYIRGFQAKCQPPLNLIDIKAFGDPPSRKF